MPVFRLDRRLVFPPPELAEEDGLLAVGGDLRPERLLLAYASGIFPWPCERYPLLWHSPDPRFVLPRAKLRISRSLAKVLRRRPFEVRLDTGFRAVIERCAGAARPGQEGTWITPRMIEAYVRLHELGYAHSAEAWQEGVLVGGLYGVSLGAAFFGESMFAAAPNASKVALVTLLGQLGRWGVDLIDCQVHTPLFDRLGAEPWPRARYLAELAT
ncbi:MAG: leucyl/phenylalanyl-tRNA--protein transferase, partial [Deltaproteobacteria bacterium]|nr:leucyl/phenylalanyl-tRNA--protein transferase [Deltaproteobacteria bacterium]